MNRPTRGKLYERRREVANFALKGWTQAAIARQIHIPPATVSRDLAAMREFWLEFPVYDFDRARLERKNKEVRPLLWLQSLGGYEQASAARSRGVGRPFVGNRPRLVRIE